MHSSSKTKTSKRLMLLLFFAALGPLSLNGQHADFETECGPIMPFQHQLGDMLHALIDRAQASHGAPLDERKLASIISCVQGCGEVVAYNVQALLAELEAMQKQIAELYAVFKLCPDFEYSREDQQAMLDIQMAFDRARDKADAIMEFVCS